MGITKKLKRLLAGNRRLAISTAAFVKKRNTLTNKTWRSDIKPLIRRAQEEIDRKLRSYPLTAWKASNLKSIQADLRRIVKKFEGPYLEALNAQQSSMGVIAAEATDKGASAVGFKSPRKAIVGDSLLRAIKPLSQSMAAFFPTDMAKIINGEISLGIVNQESAAQVARNLQQKFGIDEATRKRLEAEKVTLDRQLKQGRISKSTHAARMKPIARKLDSGSMMSYARAERIVRTEMGRASSHAAWERATEVQKTNPSARKIWIHSGKPDHRPEHVALESSTKANPVPVDDPFNVGGFPGMYPRDPMLPPSQSVNCGCTMAVVNPADLGGLGGVEA